MTNDIYPYMRHAKKTDMTLSKGLLTLFIFGGLIYVGLVILGVA